MTRSEGGLKVRNRPDSASEDEQPQKSQPIIGQFGARKSYREQTLRRVTRLADGGVCVAVFGSRCLRLYMQGNADGVGVLKKKVDLHAYRN
jgi:hypothetical protein